MFTWHTQSDNTHRKFRSISRAFAIKLMLYIYVTVMFVAVCLYRSVDFRKSVGGTGGWMDANGIHEIAI